MVTLQQFYRAWGQCPGFNVIVSLLLIILGMIMGVTLVQKGGVTASSNQMSLYNALLSLYVLVVFVFLTKLAFCWVREYRADMQDLNLAQDLEQKQSPHMTDYPSKL